MGTALDTCPALPWLGLAFETSAEGEVLAAISAESRMQGTIRRVATAAALANAEGGLGSWAMSRQGFLAEVKAYL